MADGREGTPPFSYRVGDSVRVVGVGGPPADVGGPWDVAVLLSPPQPYTGPWCLPYSLGLLLCLGMLLVTELVSPL